MKLTEKYQDFLASNFMPNAKSSHFDLTVSGWKLLVKENLTPLIEKELQLKQIGDYIWASDYENGKRKVLSFFFINDAFATLKWGWNFDFIPKYSAGKVVWARTDKSVHMHIYEVSEKFYLIPNNRSNNRNDVVISRFVIDCKNVEKSLKRKIKHHEKVFYHLLPSITEYYSATDSYEKILNRIDENMKNDYFRMVGAVNLISKAFVEEKVGMHQEAVKDFENIEFQSEKTKNEYYKKFLFVQNG